MFPFIKLMLRTFGYAEGQDIPEMHLLNFWLAPQYLEQITMQRLREEFQKQKPFPHLSLQHFFHEARLEELKKAIDEEKFTQKTSDLFSFKQTKDFFNCKNKVIKAFYDFLRSKAFMVYMEYLTGLKFKRNQVDLAATLYEDTDFLLPHDDRLEKRKLAFMTYLSNLRKRDGGTLVLYNEKGKAVKKVLPLANTFCFFAVSKHSLHEIEEVVGKVQRLTVGGWYHAH
ncbi:hypothetical protein HOI26_02755 [Candidatus Woesearchaeota archaeon]|nr:hypothetical protein [Candidatus Woesearchaeota archaeon]MBT5739998.1 hypothetical protein [Candidatus Woesearchaeota archaeon]